MFKIFSRNKKSKEQAEPEKTKKQFAPGTSITYDPNLIDHFLKDHRNLIDLFTDASEAYSKQDFASLQDNLRKFQETLTSHLLSENVRFYTYMKYLLKSDSEKSELLGTFQSEMTQIGKVVFAHLNKYSQPNSVYDRAFKTEFDEIGAALVRRIEAEESRLYPLYTQPDV